MEDNIFDKYLKSKVRLTSTGEKYILNDEIKKYGLSEVNEKLLIEILISKNIKCVDEIVEKNDRSSLVRDFELGTIKGSEDKVIDVPIYSNVDFNNNGDLIFSNFTELENFLEEKFIPEKSTLKRRKGQKEPCLSIQLNEITKLKLSEEEFKYVMEYLKEENIRVCGVDSNMDGEFENYDYYNTYRKIEFPESISKEEILLKFYLLSKTNDPMLRQELINLNMRLIPLCCIPIAKLYEVELEELYGYAYEGLVNAVDRFDFNYGTAFSTFAYATIRGFLLSGVHMEKNFKKAKFSNYFRCKRVVEEYYNKSISDDLELQEVVAKLMVREKYGEKTNDDLIKKTLKYVKLNNSVSYEFLPENEELDEEMDEFFDNSFLDKNNVEDGFLFDDSKSVEETVIEKQLREKLKNVMNSSLTERELMVLKLRFGFDDGRKRTLEEAGRVFGVRRETIRQIEIKALRKLRRLNGYQLKDFLESEYDIYNTNNIQKIS